MPTKAQLSELTRSTESMQSSDNTSYCVNILGLRAVCPFYALPQEWESFRADQWAYVEFLTESDQHMRGSTAWIPYSLANKESNSHE